MPKLTARIIYASTEPTDEGPTDNLSMVVGEHEIPFQVVRINQDNKQVYVLAGGVDGILKRVEHNRVGSWIEKLYRRLVDR